MEITIPLFAGVSIKFAAGTIGSHKYPTSRLQKGFVLVSAGHDLSEEGVGFGVPVLKRGLRTIFPGGAELAFQGSDTDPVLVVNFQMNLEEKLAYKDGGEVNNNLVYTAKNILAALIRRLPLLRGLLTAASNALRRLFAWETIFQEAEFCTNVKLIYAINLREGILSVEVDPANLGKDEITEIIIMNEQGARSFDLYRDSCGASLQKEEIGCWDKVNCDWASFVSERHQLAFTLQQVQGAVVFRGRELIGTRLAWSGFGCSFQVSKSSISYQLKIERLA